MRFLRVMVLACLAGTIAVAARAQEAAATGPASKVKLFVTLGDKPLPTVVMVYDKARSQSYFVPQEGQGCVIEGWTGPVDVELLNHLNEPKAYVGPMHLEKVDKDIVLTAREVAWNTLTIKVASDKGMALPKYRVEMTQYLVGGTQPFGEVMTDDNGICEVHCLDGDTYGLQTRRPMVRGVISSERFSPGKLAKPEMTLVVPSLESVSFRFRFVVKRGDQVEKVDVTGCEIAEAGGISSTDGVFYLQPNVDEDAKKHFSEGAVGTLRLPTSIAAQYDFADGKGKLVMGKMGEMRDVELIPRVRYRIVPRVTGVNASELGNAEVIHRTAGANAWMGGPMEDLPAGKYEIRAWVPGYRLATVSVDATAKEAVLKMEAGPRAALTVSGPDGQPLAGVTVRVEYASTERGTHYQQIRTDAGGAAALNYDDTHKPVAVIYAKGFAPHLAALDKATPAYAVKLPAPVTTKVLYKGAAGAAVSGELLWVSQSPARLRIGRTVLTDGAGEALLEPGEYVGIWMPNGTSSTSSAGGEKMLMFKRVKIGDGPVELILDEAKMLSELLDGVN